MHEGTNDPIEAFVAQFVDLKRGHHQGRATPHKPALLLVAIARMLASKPRLAPFDELDADLGRAFRTLGLPAVRTHYPFWRLRADRIWEVAEAERVKVSEAGDVTAQALRAAGALGGIVAGAFDRLQRDPETARTVAARLVELAFPDTDPATALAAFGLRADGRAGAKA